MKRKLLQQTLTKSKVLLWNALKTYSKSYKTGGNKDILYIKIKPRKHKQIRLIKNNEVRTVNKIHSKDRALLILFINILLSPNGNSIQTIPQSRKGRKFTKFNLRSQY